MDTGSAIVFSAVLATAGWLYGSRQDRIFNRRQHTYAVMERLNSDAALNDNLKKLHQFARETHGSDPVESAPPQVEEALVYILDYFEFVAATIWRGDTDEWLLKECEHSRFVRLCTRFGPFIERSRADANQPSMWTNVTSLADRWERNHIPFVQRIAEQIRQRPSFRDRFPDRRGT